MSQRRQLAAIMFTDMIGYTALMSEDEALAGRLRHRHREVLKLHHEQYNGEIIQYFGDGTLSIFNSALEAAKCAIAIQLDLRKDPVVPLRIGLHSGELVWEDGDVFGSAVNIAARLETFAVEGAILTSRKVQEELSNHRDLLFQSLGNFQLKNVARPMEIFAVANEGIMVPERSELEGKGNRIESDNDAAQAGSSNEKSSQDSSGKSDLFVNDILIDIICEELAAFNKDLDEELNKEILDIPSIKREIIDVFPTPIGEQLRILFTRSNNSKKLDDMEFFNEPRLKQLVATYRTTLQFISFIMLSQLWDAKYKKKDLKLTKDQLANIKTFFDLNSINFQDFNHATLINTIGAIFDQGQITCFIDELKSFKISPDQDEELFQAHQFMIDLQSKLLKENVDSNLVEDLCIKAEGYLGLLIKKTAFLVKYKLVTIKNIEIIKRRHEPVRYRHKQITLNRALTVATTGVAEVGVELDNFSDNKSVVFIKVDNNEINDFLNLSPFIIDENALNGNLSSKIFLFIYHEDDAYHYQFMNNPADEPLKIDKGQYPKIKDQFDRFWTDTFDQEIMLGNKTETNKRSSRFSRKR
jgi:class 3 adenylate cyclase